jgi:hypothetical protein
MIMSRSSISTWMLLAGSEEVAERDALVSFWSSSVRQVPWDLSAQPVAELHRSSCRDAVVCRVSSSSFDQLRIGDPFAVSGSEKFIDPSAFLVLTAVVPPCEFVQVAIKVLRTDPVVDTEHRPSRPM